MDKNNKAMLFNNLYYGMSKSGLIDSVKCHPCEDAPDNSLLLCAVHRVEFLNTSWKERFWFNNLEELQQVMLEQIENANTGVISVMEALLQSGWRPLYAETEKDARDLVEESKKRDADIANRNFKEFCKININKGLIITIYYFPQTFANKIMGKAKSWSQAIDEKASENLVQLELSVNIDTLKLIFTAPLLSRKNALRYGQFIKR